MKRKTSQYSKFNRNSVYRTLVSCLLAVLLAVTLLPVSILTARAEEDVLTDEAAVEMTATLPEEGEEDLIQPDYLKDVEGVEVLDGNPEELLLQTNSTSIQNPIAITLKFSPGYMPASPDPLREITNEYEKGVTLSELSGEFNTIGSWIKRDFAEPPYEAFDGWSLTEGGPALTDGSYVFNESTTLYPVWSPAYQITLNAGETTFTVGEDVQVVTYYMVKGSSMKEVEDDTIKQNTRAGGRYPKNATGFAGWFDPAAPEALIPAFPAGWTPQKDMYLYAIYSGENIVRVTGVSLDKTKLELAPNETAQLNATVAPADAVNKPVSWSSSNDNVASVDMSGNVTAKALGTATITVKTADGGKTASCTVTVKAAPTPTPKPTATPTPTPKPTATPTPAPKPTATPKPVEKVPTVSYRTHVQKIGWQGWKKDGDMSGTTGESKRLEAINIQLSDLPYSGSIMYRTHVQKYGWQGWKIDGEMAGTSGEGKRLEAIQIQLTGEMEKHYDVYYQTHIQHFGWSGWASNGEMCGSAGYAYRVEGIRIKLVKKGEAAPGKTANPFYAKPGSSSVPVSKTSGALVGYNTHVQTYGWQNFVYDGGMAGTSGQSKRLEGINIKLVDKPYSGDIVYRTHVQKYGWQAWKKNGQMSGTSGEAKRLEGIQIYLTGEMAKHYDVYYRVHAQTYGWLDWAKNGAMAGTSGLSKRLEAINIKLVPKGGKAPGKTARPNVVGGGGKLPDNPYKE